MAETLEQKVNHNEEKKEDPELVQLFRGAANTSIGVAAIGASSVLLSGIGGSVVTGTTSALGGGTGSAIAAIAPLSGRIVTKLAGKEYTSANFRNDALAGAVTVPLAVGTIRAATELPRYFGIDGLVNILGTSIPAYSLGVAGFALAAIPFYTALTHPIRYLATNKTLKGIGKDFRENYWKSTKRATIYLGLPGAAAVSLGATLPYLAPYLAPVYFGLGIAYRILSSKEKLKYIRLLNPFTYVPNFFKYPFYIAEGLASLISRAVRPSPKPAQALTSQPA